MPKCGPERTPVPEAWRPLIDGYLDSLAAIGRPSTTIGTRRHHLARMARSLKPAPTALTADDVRAWFASQTQWKRETRRGYRNSAVSFFRWLHAEELLTNDLSAKLPPIGADQPAAVPAPDRVWRRASMAAEPHVRLMLLLAAHAGLRRAEISAVHLDDLADGSDGAQLLVHGKGAKERVVPITDELADAIEAGPAGHTAGWIGGHPGWLFPSTYGGHLSPPRVGELCAAVLPGAWTLHSLRHRFATTAYRETRDLRAVQRLLGHSSLAVTERYLAVDDYEMRAAMLAAARAS